MTAHTQPPRPQGWVEQPISFIEAFLELSTHPALRGGRVEILLRNGKRYWVKSITEEWGDMLRVIVEPVGTPVYINKRAIVTMSAEPGRTGAGPNAG